MTGPIVLNGRAAVRAGTSGVERVGGEIVSRLVQARPDAYRVLVPPSRLRGRATAQAWEQFGLPIQATRRRAPLIYSPANLAPLAWPRNVVVLHDMAVWRHPEAFSRTYAAWHRRAEAAAARRALRVVTVSEFSRRELVAVLGIAPERIAVVPNGVSERFGPEADAERAMRRHGLSGSYVLAVGTADARKNLGVLEAVAADLACDGIAVAWAGGERAHLPAGGGPRGVRRLGHVPDEDLPGLYAGARAHVVPSHYEGFGLTCLEAMACGTPVVAADRAALPETCAGAALLVDPDDAAALADALRRAAGDAELRARLIEAGLRRAAGATWERAALTTDRILRELAAD